MLPSRSGRSRPRGASAIFFVLGMLALAAMGAEPKATPSKRAGKAKSAPAPASIPLPIGQEARGLVLPDYDLEGRLRARFEAATAKRIDENRIQFTGLKMTTYTPENTPDLAIDMPASTLELNSRVITSQERTTVTRADFSISGDRMRFDTAGRKGSLAGNVKMVITGQSRFSGQP